ncbi:MAG: hypothetical protein IPM91_15845 [Bacteroidetes bacterium]|nr:hypothetical protein [Bacteroidota bacterium]
MSENGFIDCLDLTLLHNYSDAALSSKIQQPIWWKNRRMDSYDMFALNQKAMINQLKIIGNDKVESINALGKGYRTDGTRHPHPWSIVDVDDCINWTQNALNKNGI